MASAGAGAGYKGWWNSQQQREAASPGALAKLFSARFPSLGRARAGVAPARRSLSAAAAEPGVIPAADVEDATRRLRPTHLVVMVNGLSGAPSNWDVLCEQLRKRLPPQVSADMLLHRSQANVRFATWDGIDRCGQRLADEVRAVAAAPENASLTRISFIGHSMGGLMARYALGVLFNPSAGTIAGLQPTHFITLATPHFGCDTDGVSAVPFITWSGGLPLLGDQIRGLLQGIAHATGAALLRRTGEHFFLLDGGGAADSAAPVPEAAPEKGRQRQTAFGTADADQPLLYQMTEDVPSKGLYFYSALKAFKTRTAYANTDGDHLVGWANSSLRPLDRLPPLPPEATREARGVVLEDPLPAAWDRDEWRKLQRLMANARSSGNGEPAAAAKLQEYRGSRAYEGPTSHPGQQVGGANGSSSSSSVWQALRNGSSSSSSSGGPNGSSGPQAASGSSDEDWGASADEDWATAAEANTAPEWGAESSGEAQGRQGTLTDGATASAAGQVVRAVQRGFSSAAAAAGISVQQEAEEAAAMGARGAAEAQSAEADLQAGLSGIAGGPTSPSAGAGRQHGSLDGGARQPASRAERLSVMLERLTTLPWRRIDVSFEGATFGLAHNNIQVTRKVLNWQGKAVPRHLVEQLSAMERLLRDAGHAGAHSSKQSSPAGKAGGEGPDGAGMAGPQLATSVVGQ